jgi:hypothetical protein
VDSEKNIFLTLSPHFLIIVKMKVLSYLLLVIFLTGVSACGQKGKSKVNNNSPEISGIDSTLAKTTLKYLATEHDFGQVKEGEKVAHTFEVLNTGKADLVLQSVKPSCGCTTPNYEKKPIRPGKKGTIEVVFDTKGRTGQQRKSVMVVTNTEPPNTVLFFTCEVIPEKRP